MVFMGRVRLGPSVGGRGKEAEKHIRRRRHNKSSGFKAGTPGVISQEAAGGVSNGHIRKGLVHTRLWRMGNVLQALRRPWQTFMEENETIWFMFSKESSGGMLEDGLEEG